MRHVHCPHSHVHAPIPTAPQHFLPHFGIKKGDWPSSEPVSRTHKVGRPKVFNANTLLSAIIAPIGAVVKPFFRLFSDTTIEVLGPRVSHTVENVYGLRFAYRFRDRV